MGKKHARGVGGPGDRAPRCVRGETRMDRAWCSRGHIRARGDARDAIWMPTPPETPSLGARGGLGSRRLDRSQTQRVKKRLERERCGPYAPETTRVGHPRPPAGSRRTSTSQNKELTSSSSAPGSPFFARAEDRGADLESAVRLRFGIGGIAVGSDAPVSVASPLASAPPVFSDGKSGGRSATDSVDSVREARGRERGRARWTSRAKSRQLGPVGSPLVEKTPEHPVTVFALDRWRRTRRDAGSGVAIEPTSSGSLGRHIARSGRSTSLPRVFTLPPRPSTST